MIRLFFINIQSMNPANLFTMLKFHLCISLVIHDIPIALAAASLPQPGSVSGSDLDFVNLLLAENSTNNLPLFSSPNTTGVLVFLEWSKRTNPHWCRRMPRATCTTRRPKIPLTNCGRLPQNTPIDCRASEHYAGGSLALF